MKKEFIVIVADNFHYMDPEAEYKLPPFDDMESAVSACKKIVDEYLLSAIKPGMTAESLYGSYTSFGEDPYIISDEPCNFSAWSYSRERCAVLTGQANAGDN